jgi:DNA-binding NarL/FixJ family response regulator
VRTVAAGGQVIAGVHQPETPASGLSPADERLLAALIVDTRSKSLAEQLFLSPRTVDNMITELYWKVGLEGAGRSRAALRDWARRNGFGGPTSP